MRLPFSMMAATIPPAATTKADAGPPGRRADPPETQRRRLPCRSAPAPPPDRRGRRVELQRRIGDGGIDAGFTAVALAASMRPVGAAFGVAC